MDAVIIKRCTEIAKIFTWCSRIRSRPGGLREFGYYIDIKQEFGVVRISERLREVIFNAFDSLKFKDIKFNDLGGLSLRVNIDDAVSFPIEPNQSTKPQDMTTTAIKPASASSVLISGKPSTGGTLSAWRAMLSYVRRSPNHTDKPKRISLLFSEMGLSMALGWIASTSDLTGIQLIEEIESHGYELRIYHVSNVPASIAVDSDIIFIDHIQDPIELRSIVDRPDLIVFASGGLDGSANEACRIAWPGTVLEHVEAHVKPHTYVVTKGSSDTFGKTVTFSEDTPMFIWPAVL